MGKVISPNDKEFADVFSRFVNGKMGNAQLTGEELANDHRYLVNEKFKVAMAFIASSHNATSTNGMTHVMSGRVHWRHPSWRI